MIILSENKETYFTPCLKEYEFVCLNREKLIDKILQCQKNNLSLKLFFKISKKYLKF